MNDETFSIVDYELAIRVLDSLREPPTTGCRNGRCGVQRQPFRNAALTTARVAIIMRMSQLKQQTPDAN